MISKIKNKLMRDGIFSLIVAVIYYPFRYRDRAKYAQYKSMLNLENSKTKFTNIYKNNLWSSDESRSGEGSEIEYTAPLRNWLVKNIDLLNIKTFVDAPCGDFNWMKLVVPEVKINYVGLDIVDAVIERNKSTYIRSY